MRRVEKWDHQKMFEIMVWSFQFLLALGSDMSVNKKPNNQSTDELGWPSQRKATKQIITAKIKKYSRVFSQLCDVKVNCSIIKATLKNGGFSYVWMTLEHWVFFIQDFKILKIIKHIALKQKRRFN